MTADVNAPAPLPPVSSAGDVPPLDPSQGTSGGASDGAVPPPREPEVRATWFLRIGAACAVVAVALGRVVAPGVRGNASEGVVVFWDRASAIGAYAMSCTLIATLLYGVYDLTRRVRVPLLARLVAICGVSIVLSTVIYAFQRRLPILLAALMAIASSVVVLSGSIISLRSAHTRAVAAVLGLLGSAALVRMVAWELAVVAGDHASARVYGWGRGVATLGVILEGLAQLIAAAWLGTRTRVLGQVMSSLAVATAFVMTWAAAQGIRAGAPSWQAVLHTALGDAAGIPSPFGLGAIATFLVAASILFALVALLQRGQLVMVMCALSLALVGRGAFDAPLRALAATTAAVWLMLAVVDERTVRAG